MTTFNAVYDTFFSLITDDMYMEISEEQTHEDCKGLLLASLPLYEFPRRVITVATNDEGEDCFNVDLSLEERNIIAYGMLQIWLQRQITTIELVRQKFSGVDFKLTSQASHLQRLMTLFQNTKDEHRRLQMLETRREIKNGKYVSTFGDMVKRMN